MSKRRILEVCAFAVGFMAFAAAQGSFAFWKQPRTPKHLKA